MTRYFMWLSFAIAMSFFIGCTEKYDYPDEANMAGSSTCVNCHLDAAKLQQSAAAGSTAELMLVDERFLTSVHGKLACAACHQGNGRAENKTEAHLDLIGSPSKQADRFCVNCHQDEAQDHRDVIETMNMSLHKTNEGFYERFKQRAGSDLRDDANLVAHFNEDCGSCHASCGQCHVSHAKHSGGGLIEGHMFRTPPDALDNCATCHSERIGAEFYGQTGYTQSDGQPVTGDVHNVSHQKDCLFCHQPDKMHGQGLTTALNYRYDDQNTNLTKCEDCHSGNATSNLSHTIHWSGSAPRLACQICHSQPYTSCNGCHVGSDNTAESYPSFKIGRNYRKTAERPYDYVTVRHVPLAPDTYAAWGVADLANYATSEPTWKLTTPHNIQRQTAQMGTGSCGMATCHDTELYLKPDDIQQYNNSTYIDREIQANQSVFMP